jgi:two-component system, cell cycle response regulator
MSYSNVATIIDGYNHSHLSKVNVLIVADSKVSNHYLYSQITQLGHQLMMASSGKQMLEMIQNKKNMIDLILIDSELPIEDMYENIGRIKAFNERNLPIIMLTSNNSLGEMQKGLEVGIYYYLTKPLNAPMLHSVLQAAIIDLQQAELLLQEMDKYQLSFHLAESCRFSFKTLREAESLSAFMANFFPNPKRALLGLGELMINAIEHGNLEVGYEGKSILVASGKWREEVEQRLNSKQYSHRTATATVMRKSDGVYLTIEDMGSGFAWEQYMQLDPKRVGDNHGRGIALANSTSFDKLVYNKAGNKVIGFMAHESILE